MLIVADNKNRSILMTQAIRTTLVIDGKNNKNGSVIDGRLPQLSSCCKLPGPAARYTLGHVSHSQKEHTRRLVHMHPSLFALLAPNRGL